MSRPSPEPDQLLDRVIIHCDMNAFYASVETALNPSLAKFKLAVAGSPENRHGVILARNQAAKLDGVKTGEVIWQAKQKCPDLVIVPPNFDAYIYYSKQARNIYCQYSDQVESYGLDEVWLDVSGSQKLFGDGLAIANRLRAQIKSDLHLTISAGISFNKVFAKFGSDYQKPDACTLITPLNFRKLVWPRPVRELLGVGPATEYKLRKFGLTTIGQLAQSPAEFLRRQLGLPGLRLHTWANGLDQSKVRSFLDRTPAKSIGHGVTVKRDLYKASEVRTSLLAIASDVSYRLQEAQLKTSQIQLALKDKDLNVRSYQTPLPYPASSASYLAQAAFDLYQDRHLSTLPLRAISLTASRLLPADQTRQVQLFADWAQLDRLESLNQVWFDLAQKYGRDVLQPASLLDVDYFPDDGADLITPPGLNLSS